MAVTRIKNNQITDSSAGNAIVGINASTKIQDNSITAGKLANSLVYGSDLTVTGNLTVNGQTTTIDTVSTVIEDPIIVLASNQTGSPTVDIGFIGERGTSNNVAFVWDESSGEFVTAFTTDLITNTIVTISSYANFHTFDANIGGNLAVGGNVSFTGNVTSLNVTGNLAAGNLSTAGQVVATGNVTGGNVSAGSGIIVTTGNINGGNVNATSGITAGTTVIATGNVSGGNVTTAGITSTGSLTASTTIDATGNITGGNVTTAGITSTGSLTASTTINATGNITGGNVSAGAGIVSTTGNINGGNVNATANITGTGAVFSGNVTAANFIGNISGNVDAGGANTNIQFNDNEVLAGSAAFTFDKTSNALSVSGNITGGNLTTAGITSTGSLTASTTINATGNITGGNVTTAGITSTGSLTASTTINATGNITGGNLTTTGITSTGSLTASTTINATGNITGGNVSAGAGIISTTGNINGGNINATTGVTATTVNATGNITGGNLTTTGITSTGSLTASTTIDATGNITGGNVTTAGITSTDSLTASTTINATGNITGGNLITTGVAKTGTLETTGNALIGGNLIVQGNVTYININDLRVEDPVIILGTGPNGAPLVANDGLDRGIYMEYYISNVGTSNAFMGYDNSTGNMFIANDVFFTANDIVGVNSYGTLEAGNLYIQSAVSTGNVGAGNFTTGGQVTATGNITGGNLITGGTFQSASITSTGNITGANLNANLGVTATTVTATGNVSAGNVSAGAGIISTTGNVNGGNVNATSGITAGTTINATGNITGGNLTTTGITSTGSLSATTTIDATGNITGGNVSAGAGIISTTGNVNGGNVNSTTVNATGNITGGNVTTAGITSTGSLTASTTINATGNITGGNVSAGAGIISTTGNINGANVNATGNVTGTGAVFSGNVTAANFIGNISGNIDAGGANTNIQFNDNEILAGSAAFTFDKTSNAVIASGNISAGNLISNGAISATTTINATGNITGGNLTTTGITSTGSLTASTTIDATGNITGGNLITSGASGSIVGTGNITGGNIATAGQLKGGNIVISGDDITDTNGRVNFNIAGGDVDFAVNGDTVANVFYVDAGTGTASFGSATQTTNSVVAFNATNSILMPVGNTIQRPAGVTGQLRFNTTLNSLEIYDNSAWVSVGQPDFTLITDQQFNGDGSTAVFTLSANATTAGSIVSINGVQQIPTIAYAVTGTTLTFTEAPASGDLIDVRVLVTTTQVYSISNSSGTAAVVVQDGVGNVGITGNVVASGIYYGDGSGLTNLSVSGDAIISGTSNMTVVSSGGNIRANVAGTTVQTISAGLVAITGDLSVTGNATLSGNILGDRIQNGTTSFDIQTPSGNANINIGGTGNLAVFSPGNLLMTGNITPTANITYNLGTTTNRWKDVYLSNSTIFMGNAQISANATSLIFTNPQGGQTVLAGATAGITGATVDVTGNITGGNISVSTGNITGGNLNISGNIVDTGALSLITAASGNVNLAPNGTNTVIATTTGANITGTLGVSGAVTGASLSVSTGNITGGNLILSGAIEDSAQLDIRTTASNGNIVLTPNGSGVIVAAKDIVNGQANGTGNIGSATSVFNTVFAKATSAQYADLAEKYTADAEYAPGTVVVFGGTKEVTVTSVDADRAVAGVVSTNPSYIMNAGLEAEHVATVALTGRVPCRVTGTVRKGDLMVSAGYGLARAEQDPRVGTVIGKALENHEGSEGVIEVVVGRF